MAINLLTRNQARSGKIRLGLRNSPSAQGRYLAENEALGYRIKPLPIAQGDFGATQWAYTRVTTPSGIPSAESVSKIGTAKAGVTQVIQPTSIPSAESVSVIPLAPTFKAWLGHGGFSPVGTQSIPTKHVIGFRPSGVLATIFAVQTAVTDGRSMLGGQEDMDGRAYFHIGMVTPLVAYPSAARWRLNITADIYSTNPTKIFEWVMRATPNGAQIATGGTASANLNSAGAASAFDGSTSTAWAVPVGSAGVFPFQLAYQLPTAAAVVEYTVKTGSATSGAPDSAATEWQLQRSDDGSTWFDVGVPVKAGDWQVDLNGSSYVEPARTFSVLDQYRSVFNVVNQSAPLGFAQALSGYGGYAGEGAIGSNQIGQISAFLDAGFSHHAGAGANPGDPRFFAVGGGNVKVSSGTFQANAAIQTDGAAQSITGLGFRPVAIFFSAVGTNAAGEAVISTGIAASNAQAAGVALSGSTVQRQLSNQAFGACVFSGLGRAAVLQSFDADGFTVLWLNGRGFSAESLTVQYFAIGGVDATVSKLVSPGATGRQSVPQLAGANAALLIGGLGTRQALDLDNYLPNASMSLGKAVMGRMQQGVVARYIRIKPGGGNNAYMLGDGSSTTMRIASLALVKRSDGSRQLISGITSNNAGDLMSVADANGANGSAWSADTGVIDTSISGRVVTLDIGSVVELERIEMRYPGWICTAYYDVEVSTNNLTWSAAGRWYAAPQAQYDAVLDIDFSTSQDAVSLSVLNKQSGSTLDAKHSMVHGAFALASLSVAGSGTGLTRKAEARLDFPAAEVDWSVVDSGRTFYLLALSPQYPKVTQIVSANDGESFGAATLTQRLSGSGIASNEALGAGNWIIGGASQTVIAAAIPSDQSVSPVSIATRIYPASCSLTYAINAALKWSRSVQPSSVASGEAFGASTYRLRAFPSGITSGEAFGVVNLASGQWRGIGIPSAESVQAIKVGTPVYLSSIGDVGAVGTPSFPKKSIADGIASAEAFGLASVAVTVKPIGVPSTEAFGPTRAGKASAIPSIVGAEAFGSTRCAQVLRGSSISDGVVSIPAVSRVAKPMAVQSSESFGFARFGLVISPYSIDASNLIASDKVAQRIAVVGVPTAANLGATIIQKGKAVPVSGIPSAESVGAITCAEKPASASSHSLCIGMVSSAMRTAYSTDVYANGPLLSSSSRDESNSASWFLLKKSVVYKVS